MHSHHLYITSWNGRPVSVHRYSGTTEPAPNGVQHTHKYLTFTSFNDGHKHQIRGVTGLAISLPGGGYYHKFNGATTVNGTTPHRHRYSGRTSL
ncbi:MAG: YmaF family protein [Bacillota bacterium]